jgi:hypothetical protein
MLSCFKVNLCVVEVNYRVSKLKCLVVKLKYAFLCFGRNLRAWQE